MLIAAIDHRNLTIALLRRARTLMDQTAPNRDFLIVNQAAAEVLKSLAISIDEAAKATEDDRAALGA